MGNSHGEKLIASNFQEYEETNPLVYQLDELQTFIGKNQFTAENAQISARSQEQGNSGNININVSGDLFTKDSNIQFLFILSNQFPEHLQEIKIINQYQDITNLN